VEEFFMAFVRKADITLHIRQICGVNSHHIIEGAFKAFARALSYATEIDERYANEIPSTKGVI
jgi:imidazoleglycerol-phosphate dehydratase